MSPSKTIKEPLKAPALVISQYRNSCFLIKLFIIRLLGIFVEVVSNKIATKMYKTE